MINFDDTTIIQSTLDSNFDITDTITADDGLAFAFGFTSYDDSLKELDPDIGELKGRIWQWGFDEDFGNTWITIPAHPCTEAELGLLEEEDEETQYLYPLQENYKETVAFYKDIFKCFNRNESISI